MTAHIYHDISEADYHADPCPDLHGHPSLSSTMARLLLDRTPAVARHYHPRLGSGRAPTEWMDQKPAMRLGTLLHALLLGTGPEIVVIEDHDKGKKIKGDPEDRTERDRDGHDYARNWMKKAVKAARAEALADGQHPVLYTERDYAKGIADVLAPSLVDKGVALGEGHAETTIMWSTETDHGVVWMRARIDHHCFDGHLTVTDLKKTRSANVEDLQETIRKFGYHVQQAAYTQALIAAYPEWTGRIRYRLAFMETEPVPDVRMVRLSENYLQIGQWLWNRAIAKWAHCIHTDDWPGHPQDIARIEPREWYAAKEHI